MPSADLLLDTSCAIALLSPNHDAHLLVEYECEGKTLGLSGHALFETLAVLTRTPSIKVTLADAIALVEDNFTASVWLSAASAATLPMKLMESGISGGSIYDALVGIAAAEHGITLLTLDRRAKPTYESIGVSFHLLEAPSTIGQTVFTFGRYSGEYCT
jgi:predicted nucleic acid-binding protein